MSRPNDDERVIVWAPRGRDGSLAVTILAGAGLVAESVPDIEALLTAIDEGVGCVMVTEETLTSAVTRGLVQKLSRQPPWSDLPLLVFANPAPRMRAIADASSPLGNVTYLERPVQIRTLLASVRSALRGRRRQYAARAAITQRDEFLAMLGHELRNPLAAIVLASDLLGDAAEGEHSRERGIILRQARHLSRLVDDLLDVSRVTSGKVVLRRELIDLVELAQRCVEQNLAAAEAKRQHLRFVAATSAVFVDGDAVRLEQVLSNLLTNAIKYTPSEGHVDVTIGIEAGEAVLRVRDDGIGIDPAMTQAIFELFAQAPASLDRSEGGLGLGLTLVRTLVQLHGGTVSARSDGVGRGAELEVRLAARPEPRTNATPTQLRDALLPLSVVLVDDNADMVELLADVLRTAGHRVEAACDGPAGLARILAVRPDVAIVDIGLPGLDGFTLARRVREQLGRDIRLVAITGYGQPEDREGTRQAGYDEHLVKPATPEQVLASLSGSAL
ncbi:MAG TPA: hybrid sensor histidine kinase/response regulator [Nannocystaceae bacterium]|nr:hybrid sensor histidine kinase/response regulator [Nannocystaceae bacterium]